MNFLSRLKSILHAKTNKALDQLENPEEALDLSLVEMKEKVREIKKALLEVTTIKKQYEQKLNELDDQINLSQQQAELSLKANRDDLAEQALEKKMDLTSRTEKIKLEINKLNDKIDVIKQNKTTLDNRITEFTNKRAELKAINKASNAQMVVKEVMAGVSNDMDDITSRIERAESKIMEKEARLSALDELMLEDESSGDHLEKELKQINKQQKIKEELELLRQGKSDH